MRVIKTIALFLGIVAAVSMVAAGVDFSSSTWVDGKGVVQSQYSVWGGPFTSFSQWTFSGNGAFQYTGDYYNGGQIRWTVTPPKEPKSLREYWEDRPAIFTSTFTRTGFPSSFRSEPSFASTFNSFGAKYGGPSFRPISW